MKKIKLRGANSISAIVDDEDYESLSKFKWYISGGRKNDQYAHRKETVCGKRISIFMHREVVNARKEKMVDHINHNTFDNRKSNLRMATRSQNAMNTLKRKDSSSLYKGVVLHTSRKNGNEHHYWRTHIRTKDTQVRLGLFKSEIDAAICYDLWAKDLFGEYAYLNFKSQ